MPAPESRIRPADPNARSADRTASRFLSHLVVQHPLAHPTHSQAVGESAKSAIHRAVFRDAELARAMIYRQLDDAISLKADQRRQKAMHAGVELHALDRFALHEFQRAAGVGDVVLRDPVANAVANSRLHAPRPRVIAIHANTDDHVAAAFLE